MFYEADGRAGTANRPQSSIGGRRGVLRNAVPAATASSQSGAYQDKSTIYFFEFTYLCFNRLAELLWPGGEWSCAGRPRLPKPAGRSWRS